jgi:Zn-dependent protease
LAASDSLRSIRCEDRIALISDDEREAILRHLSLEWFFPFFQGIFLGLVAMVLHEAGHLLAALAVGIKIRGVGLRWKGLYTVREAGPPAKNLLVSLAGPLTNLLLILSWHWSPTFGLANLCFGVCNLLPIGGSDGERVLRCWREMHDEGPLAQ